jgi:Ca-activated chloride channel homolog
MPLQLILFVFLAWFSGFSLTRIAKTNQVITEARRAYQDQDYFLALSKLQYLQNAYGYQSVHLPLNIAHCYFLNNNNPGARQYYQPFENSGNAYIRSIAYQQLAVVAYREKNRDEALLLCKKALLANPANEDARHNYEWLMRQKLSQADDTSSPVDPEPEVSPPPPAPDAPAGAEPRSGTKEPEPQPRANSPVAERLQQLNVSEEKARMMLDAIRNSETQFIQQRRRQPTQKRDPDLPDW